MYCKSAFQQIFVRLIKDNGWAYRRIRLNIKAETLWERNETMINTYQYWDWVNVQKNLYCDCINKKKKLLLLQVNKNQYWDCVNVKNQHFDSVDVDIKK